MSIKHIIAAASTAVILGACTGNSVHIQQEYNPSAYDYKNFTLYHAERDTDVDIYGNPFGIERSAFEKAVTDAMQGANFGRPTHFTTTPGPSAEKNFRVVMAFNAGSTGYGLCDSGDIATNGHSGELVLKAAWCFDNREESWVEARVAGATDPNDPRFRALVRQTVLNLFPPRMDTELIWDDGGGRRND